MFFNQSILAKNSLLFLMINLFSTKIFTKIYEKTFIVTRAISLMSALWGKLD